MNEVVAQEKAFNMSVILEEYEPEDFKEENDFLGSGKLEKSCGTSACMMGWAGSDPWHRKRGLRSRYNYFEFCNINSAQEAIEAYLDISYEEAESVFFAEASQTASEALEHLKNLAVRKGVDISIIPTEAK